MTYSFYVTYTFHMTCTFHITYTFLPAAARWQRQDVPAVPRDAAPFASTCLGSCSARDARGYNEMRRHMMQPEWITLED